MKAVVTCLAAVLLVPLITLDDAEKTHLGALASLAPPKHVALPRPEPAVTTRAFQGIPSMAVAPRGRLWVTWYAGVTPAEDNNSYVVLSTSGDGGKTWEETLTIDPDGDGPVRAVAPSWSANPLQ